MLKPKPVSDEPPDIEPLVTRTLAAATLIATMALIFVCVAVPAGAEIAQRCVTRLLCVVAVGALVTGGLLLPRQAWTDSRIGRSVWRVGSAAAWIWIVLAMVDIAVRTLAQPEATKLAMFQSADGQIRSAHLLALLILGVAAAASARPHRAVGQRLAAAAAVAAALTLPYQQFQFLPGSVRLNHAVHAAGAAVWVGTVAAVAVIGYARIDTTDPRQLLHRLLHRSSERTTTKRSRPYQARGAQPPDPAYGYLTYATTELSALALVCASTVVLTGASMGLGVAQASDDFFAGAWSTLLVLKIILATALVGFGAIHRTYTLKSLNGEDIGFRAGAVVGMLPNGLRNRILDGEHRSSGILFVWVAAVETVVLLLTFLLGVSMNSAASPV